MAEFVFRLYSFNVTQYVSICKVYFMYHYCFGHNNCGGEANETGKPKSSVRSLGRFPSFKQATNLVSEGPSGVYRRQDGADLCEKPVTPSQS